jgi:AraC-like DNA-binding protein
MGLLYEAPNVPAKFRVLERWLIRVAARELQRHPAVDLGLTTFRDQWALGAAREAQQRSNLSPRRFIQLFRDQVGLTPKLYCRIRRFQYVLDRVTDARDVDWLRTALACGYFDQSHFIHDFRAFTGLRPTEYWNLRIAGQANHVRVPD